MKKLATAMVFALAATTANADGYSDPIVAPAVIADAAVESSAPSATLVMVLATLTVFGTALSH
ncbi:hypothetical protein [Pacificoceanicola onchidii]|uniref:hypothetical protein n=1 Tax=Pacificoceanicola onchidii TaxID=2562685 RepID=UPI0010A50C8C|nr:hypothetical protein [Pacificoceanicola onchidii]